MRPLLLLAAAALSVAAFALTGPTDSAPESYTNVDRADQTYWLLWAGPTFGQPILGSEDTRRGGIYGIEYAKPEPKLRWRSHRAQIVYDAYYQYTKGQGFDGLPVNHSHSYGGIVLARYWRRCDGGLPTYLELGLGYQYANIRTQDLDSNWNTTPVIGVGVAAPIRGGEIFFGCRFFHVSNAGTCGNNQGQNQLHFTAGIRF